MKWMKMASKFMRQILLKTNRHVDKFFLEKIVNNTKKKSIDLNEKKRKNEIKRNIVINKRKPGVRISAIQYQGTDMASTNNAPLTHGIQRQL